MTELFLTRKTLGLKRDLFLKAFERDLKIGTELNKCTLTKGENKSQKFF
jgi:hypothetical protein